MKAKDLIDALARKLGTTSQRQLAGTLGITEQTLHSWKRKNSTLSAMQVASALAKACDAAVRSSQLHTIQPIVEFFWIDASRAREGSAWQVFSVSETSTKYVKGLKNQLEKCYGIYVFYDSRGRALYVGKAKKQSLWREVNLAFNRHRQVQKISLVRHPDRNQDFKPAYEKARQPRATQVELVDLASYFSAYDVDEGMIDDLEALLVRGFANDVLNKRMETFLNSRT